MVILGASQPQLSFKLIVVSLCIVLAASVLLLYMYCICIASQGVGTHSIV